MSKAEASVSSLIQSHKAEVQDRLAAEAERDRYKDALERIDRVRVLPVGGIKSAFDIVQKIARDALASERADPRVTHGRHCSCTACVNEDWSSVSVPCGMHPDGCPPERAEEQ